jgi:hypothetical protein
MHEEKYQERDSHDHGDRSNDPASERVHMDGNLKNGKDAIISRQTADPQSQSLLP